MSFFFRTASLLLTAALVFPNLALAYGGPGSVISGLGALLAALTALLASLFGFIWFPLKRLYHGLMEKDTPDEKTVVDSSGE